MYNRKHKLPATLVIVCIIALLGFKDTGIFVKDHVALKGDGEKIKFEKEENINILRETKNSYIVEKEGNDYEIEREVLLRITSSGQKYKVIKKTNILDEANRNPIKLLDIDETVQALKMESGYGMFETTDGVRGYINLENLEKVKEESISYGISKVNKVIKEGNLIYTLIMGESVAIKDFKENQFIVIDDEENEFKVNSDLIEIKTRREKPTRGKVSNVSNKSKSISKVVGAAHDALGKPYVYGDIGNKGFDCSGLTYSIYLNNLDVKLPRSSSVQVNVGTTVAKDDLMAGDLIFFNTSGRGISHVGLYIGDNNMIHASSGQKRIMISDINSTYYKQRYVTSKRIID